MQAHRDLNTIIFTEDVADLPQAAPASHAIGGQCNSTESKQASKQASKHVARREQAD
jgi:hypothetical protein